MKNTSIILHSLITLSIILNLSIQGSSVSVSDSIKIKCYDSPKYLIIVKEVSDLVGSDILIKFKSKPDEKILCKYEVKKGDLEIKNEWADYYYKLQGDLLFIESSTSPGPSGLTIWDLNKRKKVFHGTWSDPQFNDDNTVIYWLETGKATEKNCPEFKKWNSQGLGAAIETKVILNLSNFKLIKTKQTRCAPRQ